MARQTKVQMAELGLKQAQDQLAAFYVQMPDIETRIEAAKAEAIEADKVTQAAWENIQNVRQQVEQHLGFKNSANHWTPAFKAAITKACGYEADHGEDLRPGNTKYGPNPVQAAMQAYCRSKVEEHPYVKQAKEEWSKLRAASDPLDRALNDLERPLMRRKRDVEQAQRLLADEQDLAEQRKADREFMKRAKAEAPAEYQSEEKLLERKKNARKVLEQIANGEIEVKL